MSSVSDIGGVMDSAEDCATNTCVSGIRTAPIAALMTPDSCKSALGGHPCGMSSTSTAASSSALKSNGSGGDGESNDEEEEEEEEDLEYEEGPAITSETDNDVLCGRGRGVGCRPGNVKYNKLISSKRMAYRLLEKKDKQSYAAGVLKQIEELEPPGRFLCLDRAGKWKKLSRRRTLEKICTALRKDTKKKVGCRYLKDRLKKGHGWLNLAPYIATESPDPLVPIEGRAQHAPRVDSSAVNLQFFSSLLPTVASSEICNPLATLSSSIGGTADPVVVNLLNHILQNNGATNFGGCSTCLMLGTTRCMACSPSHTPASILQPPVIPSVCNGLTSALIRALSSPPISSSVATTLSTALLATPSQVALRQSNDSFMAVAAASLLDLEARKRAAVAEAIVATSLAAASTKASAGLPHNLAPWTNHLSALHGGNKERDVDSSGSMGRSVSSSPPSLKGNNITGASKPTSADSCLPEVTLSSASSSSSSSIQCLDSTRTREESASASPVPPSHDSMQQEATNMITLVNQRTSDKRNGAEAPSSDEGWATAEQEQESNSSGVYGDADESALFFRVF